MKLVAVLGGGPAGAMAAESIARAGMQAVVFDEKLAWEKPCGGGLTYKAYHEYPFLIHNDTPKRIVTDTWLAAPRAGRARLGLDRPLVIYSRFDLNRMLLDRAVKAGARLEKARVLEIARRDRGWTLRTSGGVLDADFCVVATGARNPLREVGTRWTSADTMHALGYYVAGEQRHIDIEFPRGLEGYIWVFPRCGHLSVGICGKGEPAQKLRARLDRFAAERGIAMRDAKFYSHMLPSLSRSAWAGNRVAGEGWLAVGDAAGLVDPITGEGLYYAIRSGDLAGRVVAAESAAEAKPAAYRELLRRDFAVDLEFASAIARRVFLGRFLFDSVPARMVQFVNRSPRFRAVMQDLFAGTQPYEKLKGRLLRNLAGTLEEIAMSLFVRRLATGDSRP